MPTLPPPALDWTVLVPVLLVTGTACLCLLLDLVPPRQRKGHLAAVGVLGVGAALAASALLWRHPPARFQTVLALDGFALFFNGIVCTSTALALLLSAGYVRRQGTEVGEYYVLMLFAAVGMMLMAAALDLLVVFLGLELMSLCLYVLAGFFRDRPESHESALKYFLLGAFASGFFLYGVALLYGATGTTSLPGLAAAVAEGPPGRDWMVLGGLALLLVGLGFKTSTVPFHQWAPDVYQGAPTAVTALIATGSKAGAFAALVRVLDGLPGLQPDWSALLWGLAVLTMTVGNVVALVQGHVKRLLAYSSVAHVGYILVGLTVGVDAGGAAVLYYLLVYALATTGAFGVVLLLERAGPDGVAREAVELDAYAGLGSRHPVLALALTLFLLSLIGMPPTAGFVGKLALFSAAVERGYVGLTVVAVLNSVVAAYYYLRLIVFMYMRDPEGPEVRARLSPAAGLSLAVAAWGTVYLGVLPARALALAREAVAPLLQ